MFKGTALGIPSLHAQVLFKPINWIGSLTACVWFMSVHIFDFEFCCFWIELTTSEKKANEIRNLISNAGYFIVFSHLYYPCQKNSKGV